MTRIVGVLLAAGVGDRFEGDEKLLAPLDAEPIVSLAARSLAIDGVDHVVAAVRPDAQAVHGTLEPVVDEIIENPTPADGQSRSVARGARRAAEIGADAAVFLPGDMPLIDPGTTRRLVEGYWSADDSPDAIVPTYHGRRGNPVVFDAGQFDALESLSGDVGGRALFDDIDVGRLPVEDPGIHRDVDTVADLERLQRSINGE